nr:hypothetical protein [Chitinophagaceae bacterium]
MKYAQNRSILMDKDSTYSISFENKTNSSIIFNNQLFEKVKEQIKVLENYPYGCVEQTSSKLKALIFKDKINKSLSIKEDLSKDILFLINRLNDYQNSEGSWGWWRKNQADTRMTIYAMEVLLMASQSGYTNNLYLKAQDYILDHLEDFNLSDKLYACYVLNKSTNSTKRFSSILNKIQFEDLQVIDKLYYFKLQQILGNEIPKQTLYALFQEMNSGINMPNRNNFFYDIKSEIYTAFSIFEGCSLADDYLQVFKSKLENGQLENNLNTFSRASLIESLARLSLVSKQKPIQAEIIVNDSLRINTFPFKLNVNKSNYKFKHKGGNVFVNTSEENYMHEPIIHDSAFSIRTYFVQHNKTTDTLQIGQQGFMHIVLNSFHSSEYVMVEIPIPAGLSIVNKNKLNAGNDYIEYHKNKVVIFYTKLPIGTKDIQLEFQPIFRGQFNMPASKASLMYYPFVFGNNLNRKIQIN